MIFNEDKIILDLCGGTGSWSKPYKENGYDVRLVTLPNDDVRDYIPPKNVYGILAAPPCDQFSFAKTTGNPRDFKSAYEIVNACLNIIAQCQYDIPSPYAKTTTLKFWALENPKGLLKRLLKPFFKSLKTSIASPISKPTACFIRESCPVKLKDIPGPTAS